MENELAKAHQEGFDEKMIQAHLSEFVDTQNARALAANLFLTPLKGSINVKAMKRGQNEE